MQIVIIMSLNYAVCNKMDSCRTL